MKTLTIHRRILTLISLIYLYAPLLLFFLTWTKWYFALAAISVAVYGCIHIVNDFQKDTEEASAITIRIEMFVLIAVFLLVTGLFCGWGGVVPSGRRLDQT